MNKTAIITGASKGIGKELAKVFAKRGFNLLLASRNIDLLNKIKKEMGSKFSIKVHIHKTDVSISNECKTMVEKAYDEFGRIDVLINNAGIGIYSPIEDIKEEELKKVIDVNFFGSFYCTKYSLPYLKEVKGTVINISSVAGIIPVPFMAGYSASKFALNSLSEALRAEMKKHGVHVLLVCPGVIRTGFTNSAYGNYKPLLNLKGTSPSKLAEKTFKYYEKRKKLLIYPYYYKLIIWSYRLFPTIYNTISIRMWKKKEN